MSKDSVPLNEFFGLCDSGVVCRNAELIQDLTQQIDLLKEQVQTDALTGLYNYRFFVDTLPREMERVQRFLQPLSMIMVDIDHFKKLNDQWGHEIGNCALVHIAKLILNSVRKLDFACRFGGEEFVVILPNTDLRQSICVANRIRETIESTPLKLEKHSINITASLGVDEYRPHHTDTLEGFIERVDSWLYQAKHSGRNKVMHVDLQNQVSPNTTVTPDEKDALFSAFSDNKS